MHLPNLSGRSYITRIFQRRLQFLWSFFNMLRFPSLLIWSFWKGFKKLREHCGVAFSSLWIWYLWKDLDNFSRDKLLELVLCFTSGIHGWFFWMFHHLQCLLRIHQHSLHYFIYSLQSLNNFEKTMLSMAHQWFNNCK